jgi:hypothetical protein
VLEGTTVALRIRVFHDDLTLALRQFGGRPDLEITPEARADSLFGVYFARVVRLEADGRPMALRVTASAMEKDEVAENVVWYVLEGTIPHVARRLSVLNGLLFEIFDDQQNIMQLLRLPGGERQTLYFTAREPTAQVVEYR